MQWIRAGWQVISCWVFTICFTVVATLVSFLTLGQCSRWLTPALMRFWGKSMLAMQGVRLELEGAEHLAGASKRIATFNHTSLLDTMIVSALNPVGGVSVIKREALFVPFVGMALYAMGFLLIDRRRNARARRTLARAARRMEKEKLTVFIAPEGTRTKDGALQPFKRGAFHLALETGAPIVPIVVTGAFELHAYHHVFTRAGTVRVRILPPIATTGMTEATMPAFVESLHALYARELERMQPAPAQRLAA